MFAQSPTSLKLFKQCPRKYKAQYVEHSLPYVQHPNAARGDKIHKGMELSIKNMFNPSDMPIVWPGDTNLPYVTSQLATIETLIRTGWRPEVELNVATDGYGHDVAYKSKAAWLRCRVDLAMMHPDKDYGILFDHKTGKIYDDDEIQLEANAICMAPRTGLSKFKVMFIYLDEQKVKHFDVAVNTPEPRGLDITGIATCSTPETLIAMHRLAEAFERDNWPAVKNPFCRWRDKKTGVLMGCEVKDCTYGKYGR